MEKNKDNKHLEPFISTDELDELLDMLLEWATHKEQKTHEIKNGLCDKNIEALKISNKKRAIPIIFKENKYSSVREASRKTGICQWTIRKYGREVMPNE